MDILNSVINSLQIISVAGLVCIFLQKLFPFETKQKTWLKNESAINWQYFFLYATILVYFFTWTREWLVGLIGLSFSKVYIVPAYLEDIHILAQALIIFIVLDLIAYWMHRLYHNIPFLWKFHAIHHSPKEMDWLASIRFHPIETLITFTLQYYILSGLLGFGLDLVVLMQVFRSFFGYIVHANVNWNYGKFGYFFASPVFHRWHHTKKKGYIDKNYAGAFSVWDHMFGTALDTQELPHDLGISEDIGSNAISQILSPFKRRKKI